MLGELCGKWDRGREEKKKLCGLYYYLGEGGREGGGAKRFVPTRVRDVKMGAGVLWSMEIVRPILYPSFLLLSLFSFFMSLFKGLHRTISSICAPPLSQWGREERRESWLA